MKIKSTLKVLLLPVLGCAVLSQAQTVTTDPVGFNTITLKGASDTRIALPLHRSAVFAGRVNAVDDGSGTVQAVGTPGWTASQFVFGDPANSDQNNTYLLTITSGSKEGACFKITGNTIDTLTVELGIQNEVLDDLVGIESDIVEGANNGATFSISPAHTLGSVFESVSIPDQTQVFVYSATNSQVNKPPGTVYTFFEAFSGWSDGVSPSDVSHSAILDGRQGYVVRLPGGSDDVDLVVSGGVGVFSERLLFFTAGNGQPNDIPFSLQVPVPVAIGDTALNVADQTQVLVYDNDAIGFNKPPTEVLTYFANPGGWSDGVSPGAVDNTYFLQPGVSYVLRKPDSGDAEIVESTFTPAYVPQD